MGIRSTLNSEVPYRVLVLCGVVYGLYLLTGIYHMFKMQELKSACENATLASTQAEFGQTSQDERKKLKQAADMACRALAEAAR